MLDKKTLLELIARHRKEQESAPPPLEGDLGGRLTFERAWELARDPSTMTEPERVLLSSSPRAARLVEQARRLLEAKKKVPPHARNGV